MKIDAPLRVCFVTPSLYLGGAERWILSLVKYFDPSLIRVSYIVVECENCVDPIVKDALPSNVQIMYGRRGVELAAEHGCLFLTWGQQSLDKLMEGISQPLVSAIHHGDPTCKITKPRVDSAIRAQAHLAAVSEACLACIPEEHRSRVKVIHNGADVDRVTPTASREDNLKRFGILPGQKVVLHCGRVMQDKGIGNLVNAVAHLPSEWRLLVFGPAQHWRKNPFHIWAQDPGGSFDDAPRRGSRRRRAQHRERVRPDFPKRSFPAGCG